jgi:transcriptional regulator with XRE-family HTH domain
VGKFNHKTGYILRPKWASCVNRRNFTLKVFAEKLKELRKNKKLSQKEVAAELGLSLSGYQNYEYQQRDPNIELLCKIADFFNVSTDYLLGRSGLLNPVQGRSIDVMVAENEYMLSNMMYLHTKKREGEDSAATHHAYKLYMRALGHYQKTFFEFLEEYFRQPNVNPYEEFTLKNKYPFKFQAYNDIFNGAYINLICNDGTVFERVKYYSGGIAVDPNYSMERAEKFIKEYEDLFRLNGEVANSL